MRCTSHVAGWISDPVIQACAPGRWTQSPAANHMQEYWRSCTLRYLALFSCLMIPCVLAHCMVVWGTSHLPVSLPQLHRESLTFCYTFFSFSPISFVLSVERKLRLQNFLLWSVYPVFTLYLFCSRLLVLYIFFARILPEVKTELYYCCKKIWNKNKLTSHIFHLVICYSELPEHPWSQNNYLSGGVKCGWGGEEKK